MKSIISRISYKMLVTTMITVILSFFVVTSCSHANKFSELVNDDGIYYNGTQESTLAVKDGFFTKLVNLLSSIATYLLGLMGLGIRGVFIGWIEIAEMLLTMILDIDGDLGKINDDAMDVYTENIVNVESILFNRVPILEANIFKSLNAENEKKDEKKEESKTKEEKAAEKKEKKENKIVTAIKSAVAKWYYVLRLMVIALMLILLIFVGIKMAISTVASEKAVYKQMLIDWIVGMIIVFMIHYIMVLIFTINDSVINGLEPLLNNNSTLELEEYQYGIEPEEIETFGDRETTLYESARTRAYSLNLVDGFTGMVIYGVLVYYAWRFAVMYLMRVFNIMILTLIAPVIAASYAVNKVLTGKSKIFSSWLNEYIINVIIRLFHVIIYVSFVAIALELSLESLPGIILAFIMLHFMLEADKLLRTLFKMSGGKGSLSGTMEKTNLNDIKSGIKGLGATMVGGKVGMAAMKATYGIATKPGRALVETAFGNHMAKKANQKEQEEKNKQEEKERLEEKKNDLEESIQTLKERQNNIKDKEFDAERWQAWYRAEGEETKLGQKTQELQNLRLQKTEVEKQLHEYEERLEEANDNLEYRNELDKIEALEKEFYAGTFGGAIDNLFDPFNYTEKDKKTGKYRRMRARRKGGAKYAFWRKKVDGIGMRFMESAKLKNLFNLSNDEVKRLKEQFNFSKSTVVGFFSAAFGFPTLVINPTLGVALLGQAGYSGLRMATRMRQIKNRPSYKKNKRYNFVAFNKGAQYTMKVEAVRQAKELEEQRTQKFAGKHQKFVKRLLNNTVRATTIPDLDPITSEELSELGYMKYAKQFKTALKDLNELETSINSAEFKNRFAENEKNQQDMARRMSEKQLLFNEYANGDGVVTIGDSLFEVRAGNATEQAEKKFIDDAEKQMNEKNGKTREEKINSVKNYITANKDMLIQSQIEKYYARRGIVDISNAEMSESDEIQIKKNILGILEERGIIKKGEIKFEDNFISSENVKDVHEKMQSNTEETNQSLEQRVAKDAVLEYMKETETSNKNDLLQKIGEIYDLVKDKIMSEDSKKSADVIKRISGQDKKKQVVDLSQAIKETIESDIKNVKKVDISDSSKDKETLVEHETNRKMNQTKNKLEEALCADTVENIKDNSTLEMLFALSRIGENNYEAVEVLGKKRGKAKKAQLETLEFYQDGSRRLDKNKDGSRKFDETKDGSKRLAEEYFMESKKEALEKRLFGPSQNVMDLINNV